MKVFLVMMAGSSCKIYSFCSEDYMQDGNWEYCLNTIFLFYRYKKPLILNKKIKGYMMQGYKDLVIQAKNDSKYMQSLLCIMEPLVKSYAKKYSF